MQFPHFDIAVFFYNYKVLCRFASSFEQASCVIVGISSVAWYLNRGQPVISHRLISAL